MVIATEEQQQSRRRNAKSPTEEPNSHEQVVAAPTKLRRRPVLIAASVAAVCLGALLGMMAYTSASSAKEVIALRTIVHRGDVIQRNDLMTVRLRADSGVTPVSGNDISQVVGKRAAYDMAAGGLLTWSAVTSTLVPASGQSVVGVGVTPGQLPAIALQPGDNIRVITTPGGQGGSTAATTRASTTATVVDVQAGGSAGQQVVDVAVPDSQAAELAVQASTGKVAIVLDSREH
ncbi:flagellar protein FlgA [Flexivirga endophytica]|jgi:Flagellar basal body P-ring biosynthesis protein|uniref:Flagellar protein FlgA n=1 Tax=Flexivirga endophytica TaxID=1849103 RepID=A0A916SXK2_9MICO|nr:SAF domain-containing protein [Flexivirga endophytica]GGB21763.1 flagellar protein FlgA [Flexivirga endophytica]GHB59377.1 flagellar protein FlgA [Flexivirga endophytica]